MPNLCSFVCDRHTEMGLVIDMKQSWLMIFCVVFLLLRRTKHSTYRVKCIFSTFFAFSHDEIEDDSCFTVVVLWLNSYPRIVWFMNRECYLGGIIINIHTVWEPLLGQKKCTVVETVTVVKSMQFLIEICKNWNFLMSCSWEISIFVFHLDMGLRKLEL